MVVAITGATGAVYGVRLLEQLRATPGVETHLVISDAATLTLHQETGMQRRDVEALAHVVHKNREIGASIASGSFHDRRHGDRALLDEDPGRRRARACRTT